MIEIRGLTKRYGSLVAVDHLNLVVERGDAFGFIGPNGAGKTTTIRMLATLLAPDYGTATVNGHDVRTDPEGVRASVGYMPDFFGVYTGMKVWEYLDFFATAYRVPSRQRKALINDVLELTDLSGKRETFVEGLSRGMKQRLCLAKTLVHDPQVLLLDEPASGLDPRARVEVRELLRELIKMEKTILVSSHILPELADLCNKIAIIEQGKLVAAGSIEEMSNQIAGGVTLTIGLAERIEEARQYLQALPEISSANLVEGNIEAVYCGPAGQQRQLLVSLINAGFPVDSFGTQKTNLESLYMRITRGVVS